MCRPQTFHDIPPALLAAGFGSSQRRDALERADRGSQVRLTHLADDLERNLVEPLTIRTCSRSVSDGNPSEYSMSQDQVVVKISSPSKVRCLQVRSFLGQEDENEDYLPRAPLVEEGSIGGHCRGLYSPVCIK